MTVIFAIIRILLVLLIIRIVVSALMGRRGRVRRAPAAPPMPERAGGTLVRDPQCGTYVPESRAVTMRSGTQTVHFCSATCRDAWLAANRSSERQVS